MAIVKWNPFREIETLQERINRLFGDTGFSIIPSRKGEATWAPQMDIYEDNNEIVVKAELPGLEEKDVEVSVENNVLSIKGKRKLEHEEKRENYHMIESSYGSFFRSFTLPGNVDPEKANAKFEKGVLRVTLPKKPEAKPKHISIKLN